MAVDPQSLSNLIEQVTQASLVKGPGNRLPDQRWVFNFTKRVQVQASLASSVSVYILEHNTQHTDANRNTRAQSSSL